MEECAHRKYFEVRSVQFGRSVTGALSCGTGREGMGTRRPVEGFYIGPMPVPQWPVFMLLGIGKLKKRSEFGSQRSRAVLPGVLSAHGICPFRLRQKPKPVSSCASTFLKFRNITGSDTSYRRPRTSPQYPEGGRRCTGSKPMFDAFASRTPSSYVLRARSGGM
jgi:hypothetical protein